MLAFANILITLMSSFAANPCRFVYLVYFVVATALAELTAFELKNGDSNHALPPGPGPSATLRVPQRHRHRAGRFLANRVGARPGHSCLGCGWEEVPGSDRGVWSRRRRPRQSTRRQGWPKPDGPAPA